MTYTSDRTQWQVKETKSINTSVFGFSVTAMPGFILIGEEVNLTGNGRKSNSGNRKKEFEYPRENKVAK